MRRETGNAIALFCRCAALARQVDYKQQEVHMGEQRKLSGCKEEKYAPIQSIFLGNLHLAGKRQERKLYSFQGKGLPHGGEKPALNA